MKMMNTWACSLTLLTLIGGGLTLTSAPSYAQTSSTSVKIRLAGTVNAGVVPEGSAEFKTRPGRASLQVEASRVALADGTVLIVKLNGVSIGTITLVGGQGKMQIEGKGVPAVKPGDVVTVSTAAGAILLKGTF